MRAIALTLMLTACSATIPEGQLMCADVSECPPEWFCSAGFCYSSLPPTPIGIAANVEHSCAAFSDGSAYCWGDNEFGQLGSGQPDLVQVTMARAVEGLPGAVLQIVAGGEFTCARHETSVSCWGRNNLGQMGNGTTTTHEARPVVVDLPIGDPAVDISAGFDFACAALASGELRCWGSDSAGQLARNPAGVARTPVVIATIDSVEQVAAGYAHVCARTSEGGISCWGYNASGQLGRGTVGGAFEAVPSVMAVEGFGGATPATFVDAGAAHTCAVTATAQFCWGANGRGELGDGTTTGSALPVMIATPLEAPVARISAGGTVALTGAHTCAIGPDETLYCWGEPLGGRLGIGDPGGGFTPAARPTPEPTHALIPVLEVSAGGEHTCAIANGGQVHCWGGNGRGQLGNITTTSSNDPVAVVGLP